MPGFMQTHTATATATATHTCSHRDIESEKEREGGTRDHLWRSYVRIWGIQHCFVCKGVV